jgi:hypothetical protein
MPQAGRRHHEGSAGPGELRGNAADHHRPQRYAVYDIGALVAYDFQRLKKLLQAP